MRLLLFIPMFVGLLLQAQTADDPVAAFFNHSALEEPVHSYIGSQRLEGTWSGLSGWIEASTEFSNGIFSYKVVGEGGSTLVINKALKPILEEECQPRKPEMSAFSGNNYDISLDRLDGNDLTMLRLQPRRKDKDLIDGYVFIRQNGDLVRVEGSSAKSHSFWTFNEKVTRYYDHIAGARVPVRMVSSAVLFFKPSSLVLDYNYNKINGRKIK